MCIDVFRILGDHVQEELLRLLRLIPSQQTQAKRHSRLEANFPVVRTDLIQFGQGRVNAIANK